MRPATPLLPRVPSRALGVVLIAAVLLTTGSACQLLGGAETTRTPPDSVTVLWAGAVTDSSVRVVARPAQADQATRLAVDTSRTFATPRIVEGTPAVTNPAALHFCLADLSPNTTYHYALSNDGAIDTTQRGQFRTFADRAFSFRVALGACATMEGRRCA